MSKPETREFDEAAAYAKFAADLSNNNECSPMLVAIEMARWQFDQDRAEITKLEQQLESVRARGVTEGFEKFQSFLESERAANKVMRDALVQCRDNAVPWHKVFDNRKWADDVLAQADRLEKGE